MPFLSRVFARFSLRQTAREPLAPQDEAPLAETETQPLLCKPLAEHAPTQPDSGLIWFGPCPPFTPKD
ncbi:MAG: hypothetical protein CGU28_15295 [Candidatus Dactylopiibacterium carminicum]|uniref:Uncharacterized protein n=1 Tax=Candidatus Dactylopiibacterium carminicum TaxID=857335 RepID=A0ABQ7HLH6_9RHOO|nr:hypothetical protein BGI27_15575 [Candidatus Dactylopiibacterium carminicum]PAS93277.1 MAG: hypothetical protein CGU28_15295 [Candidatus Dactylopiibacterium carminicum]PAS96340.1 MAG: hypothetical protein BSR46_15610 [Candidatus Dactylopiibacterium carminicum]